MWIITQLEESIIYFVLYRNAHMWTFPTLKKHQLEPICQCVEEEDALQWRIRREYFSGQSSIATNQSNNHR